VNAEHRIAALRRRLADAGLDAVLITGASNMTYLTGFERVIDPGINAACLVTPDISRFYTDFRYQEAAEAAALGTSWVVRIQKESLYVELCQELHAEGVESLAIESSVPYGRFKFVSEQFQGRVEAVSQWVEEIRQVKEPHEIERISIASRIGDAAFEHIVGFIRPGLTEREVALELEFFMRRNGSEGVAFDPIVASGPNSARPHAQVSDRVICVDELVKLDFGARVEGYCSDMTRTVVVGKASERHREIYDAALEANSVGLRAVRPGLQACEIDRAARDALAARGFGGEYFGHSLGHGVGLDVHEQPSIGPLNRDSVRIGSVITIEPGVYVPGFGGVRIEDLVVVEESGARLLSHSTKDLIEL
jgi:Xaa-Pro aminopeptidase